MSFAAICVLDFPLEAILRSEPALREQALAVLQGTPPLLRVIACNRKAAQAGVEDGMTRMQAGACLPESGIRLRSAALEASAHAALLDCACAFSPRVEDTAAEAVVLDLEGLERIFGPPAKIACDLLCRCSEMGLQANVAVASNPDTALLAARGFAGVTIIPAGKEGERLGDLPVDVLLAVGGTGAESGALQKGKTRVRRRQRTHEARLDPILETLDRWGIRNLRALAALPEVAITERLGQEGLRLKRLAQGAVSRPLVAAEPPLEFEETAELEYPVELLEPLAFVLNRMLEHLCARLQARALSTHELRLRLELERTGDSPRRRGDEAVVHERTLYVPVPMRDAKVFLKLLQLDLKMSPPMAPVRKIWLRAEPVRPRVAQGGLFLPAVPPPEKLELTLARIAGILNPPQKSQKFENPPQRPGDAQEKISELRFPTSDLSRQNSASGNQKSEIGNQRSSAPRRLGGATNRKSETGNPQWPGSPELLDTHRPGAFRMRRFVPPDAPQAVAPGCDGLEHSHPATLPITALRILRPPVPVAVEVREGRPLRLACDQCAAFHGEVVWAAGPWCSSGEWWTGEVPDFQFPISDYGGSTGQTGSIALQQKAESGWAREDWDLAVRNGEGVAMCRVCREAGSWKVEGIYD